MTIWLGLLIIVGSISGSVFLAGPCVDFIVRHWEFFKLFAEQERRIR